MFEVWSYNRGFVNRMVHQHPPSKENFCEAQGKGRQKVDSGSRLSIVNCRLSIIDIDFPEALH